MMQRFSWAIIPVLAAMLQRGVVQIPSEHLFAVIVLHKMLLYAKTRFTCCIRRHPRRQRRVRAHDLRFIWINTSLTSSSAISERIRFTTAAFSSAQNASIFSLESKLTRPSMVTRKYACPTVTQISSAPSSTGTAISALSGDS